MPDYSVVLHIATVGAGAFAPGGGLGGGRYVQTPRRSGDKNYYTYIYSTTPGAHHGLFLQFFFLVIEKKFGWIKARILKKLSISMEQSFFERRKIQRHRKCKRLTRLARVDCMEEQKSQTGPASARGRFVYLYIYIIVALCIKNRHLFLSLRCVFLSKFFFVNVWVWFPTFSRVFLYIKLVSWRFWCMYNMKYATFTVRYDASDSPFHPLRLLFLYE